MVVEENRVCIRNRGFRCRYVGRSRNVSIPHGTGGPHSPYLLVEYLHIGGETCRLHQYVDVRTVSLMEAWLVDVAWKRQNKKYRNVTMVDYKGNSVPVGNVVLEVRQK